MKRRSPLLVAALLSAVLFIACRAAGAENVPFLRVRSLGCATLGQSVAMDLTAVYISPSVVWAVNGIPGGNATYGTITTSGVYTAPQLLPSGPNSVTITATSTVNSAVYGTSGQLLCSPTPVMTGATAKRLNGALSYLVEVKGSGFKPNSQISLFGYTRATTYVSPNLLQATVTLSPGTLSIPVFVATIYAPATSNTINVGVTDAISMEIQGAPTVRLLTQTGFGVRLNGTTNTSVTWNVNGIAGGNATVGTISSAGIYTPPATLPAGAAVTIGAVSAASENVTASRVLQLQNPYVQITSRTATKQGNTLNYLVDVQGTGFLPTSVIRINDVPQKTRYLSPTQIQTLIPVAAGTTNVVMSVSQLDPGGFTTAGYNTLIQQPVQVTLSGPGSPRLTSTVSYAATVAGTTNTAVVWKVNDVTGGTAETGTITQAGLYTAPALRPSGTVTVSAVSVAAPQCFGAVTLGLQNPVPVIKSGSGTQLAEAAVVPVEIRGAGFIPESGVLVNGATTTSTFISPVALQAMVTVPSGATTVSLSVLNPSPAGGTSNTYVLKLLKTKVTAATAARLLDQTTFGPTASDIVQVQQTGIDAYLDTQMAFPVTTFRPLPTNPLPSHCQMDGNAFNCTESEFWRTALTSNDQLRQRVAFALSEIFVVSMPNVNAVAAGAYHDVLAKNAFGNVSTLLRDVTLSVAMGQYLNMLDNSGKPGQVANENFAREMMQLFTIGPYQLNADGTAALDSQGRKIPTYTQEQVQAFAKVYTGWTMTGADGTLPNGFPYNRNVGFDRPMSPYEAAHNKDAKTLLLGTTLPAGQSAQQDLDGALNNLFQHPNMAPFFCRQMIQHLVSSDPSPAYVGRVTRVFADNGSGVRGDMKAILRAILTDPEARAGDSDPNVDGGHLREPILLLTNLARAFNFTNTAANQSYMGLSAQSTPLSQRPFAAPSVFGFYRPTYVIPGTNLNAPEFQLENNATATMRMTMVDRMVMNIVPGFNIDLSTYTTLAAIPADLVDTLSSLLMHSQMPIEMRSLLINTITPISNPAQRARVAIYLVLTSPQYLILH